MGNEFWFRPKTCGYHASCMGGPFRRSRLQNCLRWSNDRWQGIAFAVAAVVSLRETDGAGAMKITGKSE